jgi:hypothetical protein
VDYAKGQLDLYAQACEEMLALPVVKVRRRMVMVMMMMMVMMMARTVLLQLLSRTRIRRSRRELTV